MPKWNAGGGSGGGLTPEQIVNDPTIRAAYAPPAIGGGRAVVPLDLPTYDGDPRTTHPSVVLVPEGWNGYRYWMGVTPFPYNDRENPSILASHNGVDWEVPAGLTNPVVPASEATGAGFAYNSDTELVRLPDNSLALYYRAYGGTGEANEAILRKTSTDGRTWSAAQTVLVNTTGAKLLAPTIVIDPDGTWFMWVVDDTVAINRDRVRRYTSTDGVTWTGPTTCTVPPTRAPWHTHVVYAAGQYHMLVATRSPYRLVYYTSTDGLTWAGSSNPMPLSGQSWDQDGNYRSCLVPIPGEPLRFQMWVTGLDLNGASDPFGTTARHRVSFYDRVRLPLNGDDGAIRARTRVGSAYGTPFSGTATAQCGQGDLRVSPFWVSTTTEFGRIGVEVTAAGDAGATVRIGVWADDGTGYPAGVVFDSGEIDATTTGVKSVVSPIVLQPGLYWIGAVTHGNPATAPTYRAGTGSTPVSGQNFSAFATIQAGWRDTTQNGPALATFTDWTPATAYTSALPRVLLGTW